MNGREGGVGEGISLMLEEERKVKATIYLPGLNWLSSTPGFYCIPDAAALGLVLFGNLFALRASLSYESIETALLSRV